jgi:hypothetical protein
MSRLPASRVILVTPSCDPTLKVLPILDISLTLRTPIMGIFFGDRWLWMSFDIECRVTVLRHSSHCEKLLLTHRGMWYLDTAIVSARNPAPSLRWTCRVAERKFLIAWETVSCHFLYKRPPLRSRISFRRSNLTPNR